MLLNSAPVHCLGLASARACLYVMAVVTSRVVEALTSIACPFPGEGTYLLKGRVPRVASLSGALTLGASRDAVAGYLNCHTVLGCTFVHFWGIKLEKVRIGRVLVPFHVSRDCRFRWEHGRRIKCPGSCTRDRRWEAPLRSRSIDSPQPLPYSMVVV